MLSCSIVVIIWVDRYCEKNQNTVVDRMAFVAGYTRLQCFEASIEEYTRDVCTFFNWNMVDGQGHRQSQPRFSNIAPSLRDCMTQEVVLVAYMLLCIGHKKPFLAVFGKTMFELAEDFATKNATDDDKRPMARTFNRRRNNQLRIGKLGNSFLQVKQPKSHKGPPPPEGSSRMIVWANCATQDELKKNTEAHHWVMVSTNMQIQTNVNTVTNITRTMPCATSST